MSIKSRVKTYILQAPSHVRPPLQGAEDQVWRPLHAREEGRRGAGGERPLQGPAGWQGPPVLQVQVQVSHLSQLKLECSLGLNQLFKDLH